MTLAPTPVANSHATRTRREFFTVTSRHTTGRAQSGQEKRSVTCKPASGAQKTRSVIITSGETAMAMFKLN
jgi:hypothetical protein